MWTLSHFYFLCSLLECILVWLLLIWSGIINQFIIRLSWLLTILWIQQTPNFLHRYPVPIKFTLTEIGGYALKARTMEFSKCELLEFFFFQQCHCEHYLTFFILEDHRSGWPYRCVFFFFSSLSFTVTIYREAVHLWGLCLIHPYERNVSPPGWWDQELCLAMCDLPRLLCLIWFGNFFL